jgi:YggT family protein
METSLYRIADLVLQTLWWVVIGRVFVSWVDPAGQSRLGRVIYDLSEPILGPMRRIVPPLGGLDWSPLVTMLLLQFLRGLV